MMDFNTWSSSKTERKIAVAANTRLGSTAKPVGMK
jgi:hypothetical protein